MSGTERRKGAKGELEVAKILTDAGLPCSRNGRNGISAEDLAHSIPGVWIETKRTENARIWPWIAQAEAGAPEGTTPVVVFRRNRSRWYACLPLDDLIELLKRSALPRSPSLASSGRRPAHAMSATATTLVVTGSEAAAACGVDPFRSPVALWAEKLNLAPERDDNEAMRWGNLLEPLVAHEAARQGAYRVRLSDAVAAERNKEYPWLTGHPDGWCDREGRGTGIYEGKTTSPWRAGEWDDEQTPPHVVVQAHVYMLLTGLRWTLAACLVGGQKLELREFDYDEDIAAIVIDKTQEFLGYVERQEPPPPDGARSTTDLLARLYPHATGEIVELDAATYALVREREALREQAKAIAEQQAEREQRIKLALGDASVGTYSGRQIVTWTTTEKREYTVAASSSRTFRVAKGWDG